MVEAAVDLTPLLVFRCRGDPAGLFPGEPVRSITLDVKLYILSGRIISLLKFEVEASPLS